MISNKTVKVCLVAIFLTFSSLIAFNDGLVKAPEPEPPVTSISYDSQTGTVTLIAQDFPLNTGSGVKATYYIIDDGEIMIYTGPFKIPEGTHTIKYWSEDNAGFVESQKTATYTFDTTPPTVEIVYPELGKLYLFGSPLMDRLLGENTLLIGKMPIEVDADDADGTGVSMVLFNIGNDSGYDFEPPYTYEFTNMKFGELTISVKAIDNKGLVSEPVEMKVIVFGLGLL